jgi:hypothetical protein
VEGKIQVSQAHIYQILIGCLLLLFIFIVRENMRFNVSKFLRPAEVCLLIACLLLLVLILSCDQQPKQGWRAAARDGIAATKYGPEVNMLPARDESFVTRDTNGNIWYVEVAESQTNIDKVVLLFGKPTQPLDDQQ